MPVYVIVSERLLIYNAEIFLRKVLIVMCPPILSHHIYYHLFLTTLYYHFTHFNRCEIGQKSQNIDFHCTGWATQERLHCVDGVWTDIHVHRVSL